MNFDIAKPSAGLSEYIKGYWGIKNVGSETYLHRIIPNGLPELQFYLGDKPKSTDANKNISDNSILSGQQSTFYDIEISGTLDLFSVTFYPHTVHLFFDKPIKDFSNTSVSLIHIEKELTKRIEEALNRSNIFSDRVLVVEQFLLALLKKNYKAFELKRITHCLAQINRCRGNISIEKLAAESFLSRKQFERTFNEHMGINPKKFIRTVRFQNSLASKSKNQSMALTELAHYAGYFDQSHMINDFKTLSGMTPKKFFKDCDPYSDYFD